MLLRRRIRKLNERARAAWEKGLADAAPEKKVYQFDGGPERHAYKAAVEAARKGEATRYLPLDVWAIVLAEDARGW
jgi:hypothetical protein